MSDVGVEVVGFELVKDGLSTSTRRDLERPRHWRGLTAVDRGLLAIWVRDRFADVSELHTDVVCGLVPVLNRDLDTPANQACVHALHPLRIDACAWYQNKWWILECKPSAGHQALGQILCYGFWAKQGNARLVQASLGIITDVAQDIIKPVCDLYAVTLFQVGPPSPG